MTSKHSQNNSEMQGDTQSGSELWVAATTRHGWFRHDFF